MRHRVNDRADIRVARAWKTDEQHEFLELSKFQCGRMLLPSLGHRGRKTELGARARLLPHAATLAMGAAGCGTPPQTFI